MSFRLRGANVDRLTARRAQTSRSPDGGMQEESDRISALEQEIQTLRGQLAKTEAALRVLTGKSIDRVAASLDPDAGGTTIAPFRLFVEHMREGTLILSESGTIRYCNEAMARLIGEPKSRMLGRYFGDLIATDSSCQMRRLLESHIGSFEVDLRGEANHTVKAQISCVPPLAIGGRMVRCFIVTDVDREQLHLRHEAVIQASKDAIYVLSPSLQIQTWNRGAESIFGYAPAEIIGKSERDLCPPSELEALDELIRQVEEHSAAVSVDAVRWRKDHTKIRVILSLTPICELTGRTMGFAVVAHDITERKRTERQLRDAVARTSLALAAGQMGTFEQDLGTNECTWSDQVYAIHGLDRATFQPTISSFRALVHPEDQATFDACRERALRDGFFETELRVRHRDGRYIWVHSRGLIRYSGTGEATALFGVVSDITERKQAERNQQLLIGELNHRVRNTLATVQAIASQTLRRAKSPSDFVPSFSGRIQALSRAHTLLTKTAWQGTELDTLIREQLLLGGADRITCSGPPVSLEPQTALQLALVLHELGTNARKYGSLSVPNGSVTVRWTTEEEPDGRALHLTWTETGGPPVTQPESTGFGTLLIERSLQQGQGGYSRICFDPEGVTCSIQLLLSRPEPQMPQAPADLDRIATDRSSS